MAIVNTAANDDDPLAVERAAAAEAAWAERWALTGAAAALAALALLALPGCAYLDAAHAVKEEGKAYAARLNDHYADDVGDLARTIPAGALARMPAGTEKCALAALAGLSLRECTFVAVPAWAGEGR